MTTETNERFKGHQPHTDSSKNAVGHKEGSGFTHATNIEPITYQPDAAYKGNIPVSVYLHILSLWIPIICMHYSCEMYTCERYS